MLTNTGLVFFLAIGIASCSNNKENKITIDLDKCLMGKNKLSFGRLARGTFDGLDDPKLTDYMIKLKNQIKFAIGDESFEFTEYEKMFYVRGGKHNSFLFNSSAVSSKRKGTYSTLGIYLHHPSIKLIPKLPKEMIYSDFEVAFDNEIISKGEPPSREGIKYYKYSLKLCGENFAEVSLVPENRIDMNSYQAPYYPAMLHINLSPKKQTVNDSELKKETMFSVGDRIYVHFQSSKQCPATILVSGKEQSKIEYNKWCETGLISSKQKGEQEWAPNSALSSR